MEQNNFVKGYITDAAVDVVMTEDGVIIPGFSRIKLPVNYKPLAGEVAIVSARTSTLNAGIFTPIGLIDSYYEGTISAWVFNCSGRAYHYKAGDRLFSVVNLQLAPTRAQPDILNIGPRGKNNVGSTGGHSNGRQERD
jgi:dUTPase